MESLPFKSVSSKNAVKLACETVKLCFIVLHSSSGFGKVRELVGKIKYAFVFRAHSYMCCTVYVKIQV